MKTLRAILIVVYPILIALLLIAHLKACDSETPSSDTSEEAEPVETPVEEPDTEPVDSSDVVRHAEQVGGGGALKVTLLWDFEGDIDVHVIQPNGSRIFYDRKIDEATGGELDVDNQRGGNGSAENIFWSNPPQGEYQVSLVYYQASKATGVAGAGTCRVVMFQEGKSPQTYTTEMTTVHESKHIVTINIP